MGRFEQMNLKKPCHFDESARRNPMPTAQLKGLQFTPMIANVNGIPRSEDFARNDMSRIW